MPAWNCGHWQCWPTAWPGPPRHWGWHRLGCLGGRGMAGLVDDLGRIDPGIRDVRDAFTLSPDRPPHMPRLTSLDVSAKLVWAGARRCGRTQKVTTSRAAMKATRVVTMAGWMRRMSTPAVTPSAKAKRAYPIGVMPRSLKMTASKRFRLALSTGPRPPGHHEAEEPGDYHARNTHEAELDRQPAGAGDALGPGQAEGAGLELAGDKRRPPEDADEGGDGQKTRLSACSRKLTMGRRGRGAHWWPTRRTGERDAGG